MPKERFKLVSAVHLFLVKNYQVLLLRRFNTGYEDGNYSVPAGHLDGNEPVRRAMARESLEEIGVIIHPEDLRIVHVMHRTNDDGERIDFFLATKMWTGEPTNKEPNKCDDLRWFAFNDLPPNIIPYVRSAIEQYKFDVPFSEFGWK